MKNSANHSSKLPKSLQGRLTVLVSFAVAAAIAVTGFSAYTLTRWQIYSQLDAELLAISDVTSKWVSESTDNSSTVGTQAMKSAGVSLLLVPADGSTKAPIGKMAQLTPNYHDISIARRQQGFYARTDEDTEGIRQRIVTVPLSANGKNFALMVAKPLQATDNIAYTLTWALLVLGCSGAITAGAIGYGIARSGIRPLRTLTDELTRITRTDDLRPIPVSGTDEVAALTKSFNSLLDSLSSSRERQRRLIADAGHELRTPLTSMRTNIELLLADQSSNMLPKDIRAEILKDVVGQLSEFSSLVGDLVQLSREDQLKPAPEPIDLRNVVESALTRVRRRGRGMNFDVQLASLTVIGEPDNLERAILNLLDNAVKFSPENGTIRVRLKGEKLTIEDQGPGIAEEDLPHVFDRFYRSQQARNTPGSGLGLSIVAQTIKAHGGWVRVGHSPLGGAMFTMRLPSLKEHTAINSNLETTKP